MRSLFRNPAGLFRIVLSAMLVMGLRLGVGSAAGSGENWPQFLGPSGDNISSETDLLETWPSVGPPLVWKREAGSGYSAPSARDRQLVLHHRIENEEIVEALDTASGQPIWRYAYPSHFIDPYGYNDGPRCTPLLSSNRCYTFGAEGTLTCLDLQSGRLVWQRHTAKDWRVPEAFFGVGSTPVLEDGRLIVMVGGQPNSGVVALDPDTGMTIWENVGRTNWHGARTLGWRAERPYAWTGEEKLASYSSPVAATIHGRRHLFCLMRQGLVSLDPRDGDIRFSRWFQAQADESVNAIRPVVWNDLVLVSAAYYRVGAVLLRVKADGRSFEEVWRDPQHPLGRDPITGRFTAPALELHWNTPVLLDGHLYAFSGRNEADATFRCVEFTSGKLRWSRDESWRRFGSKQPPVYGRGSAIFADGKLVVLGEGGKLGLFKPNPERPDEVCSFQVPQLRYPCWTAPVLSRGKLYLRSEEMLLCFDLKRE